MTRMVVAMFNLDPRVVELIGRCTSVLEKLDATGDLAELRKLSSDVQSPSLVMDIGVAYLLNAVSRMHTHPQQWPDIWSMVRSKYVGVNLPTSKMRKKLVTERAHQIQALEDTFGVVAGSKTSDGFADVAGAMREVVCAIAIRTQEPDVLERAWRATIACYIICYDVATAANYVGLTNPG